MSNYFVFNGTPSTSFNAYIARSNMFDAPERTVESVSIPGRNGNLHIDQGRYDNFSGTIEAYIPNNMATNLDGLRNWLLSYPGYCRYEEVLRPDEYRMARYTGPFQVTDSDRVGAALTLNFDCMPQRFMKSGEEQVEFTAAGEITNPTRFEAKPLIRVYGTGTLGIGSETITITQNPGYIDINCEMMDAYYGATNCNNYITLSSGEFPVLAPGYNGIEPGTGITQVIITPRWWIL